MQPRNVNFIKDYQRDFGYNFLSEPVESTKESKFLSIIYLFFTKIVTLFLLNF